MNRKKKQVRSLIIAAIILVGVISTIIGVKIESAHSKEDKKINKNNAFEIYEVPEEANSEKNQVETSATNSTAEPLGESQETKVDTAVTAATSSGSSPVSTEGISPVQGNSNIDMGVTSADSGQREESANAVGIEENGGSSSTGEAQTGSTDDNTQNHTDQQKEYINCSIEVRCDILTQQMETLTDENIKKYIPSDGIILKSTKVKIEKGASVYDVLSQVTKNHGIHLDSTYTPMYKNYYVKAIGYLYEKAAGASSGWRYKVNEAFSNYGCSAYILQEGDMIIWEYSLNLGT